MMTTCRSAAMELEMFLDEAGDLFLGRQAHQRFLQLAVLEDDQRRDAAYLEPARRDVRVLVDVHLADRGPPLVIGRQLLDDRRDPPARSTPFRPEIHEYYAALRFLVKIAVCQRLDLVGCHVCLRLVSRLYVRCPATAAGYDGRAARS